MKLVSTLLVAGVASTALGSAFGGPYRELPGEFRGGIEARVQAVAPADIERETEAQQSAWFEQQLKSGLVRLDDATLTRRYRLQTAAIARMSIAACAAAMREVVNGTSTSRASSDALLSALVIDERKDWIEIAVEGLEAQGHATPVPRTVSDDVANGVFARIGNLATPDERGAIQAYVDLKSSDSVVCGFIRAIYSVSLRLPEDDLATIARYDVQP